MHFFNKAINHSKKVNNVPPPVTLPILSPIDNLNFALFSLDPLAFLKWPVRTLPAKYITP